jgi:hypothetical protein
MIENHGGGHMRYRIFFVALLVVLILSACGRSDTSNQLATQVATLMTPGELATVQITSGPQPPTQTPPPITALQQTSPPLPDARITITNIQETAPGRAIIYWDAIGTFAYGFNVVWTTETRQPSLPNDPYTYTSNPDARSAMISGNVGQVYIVRVCRVTGAGCDVYSEVGIFAFTRQSSTQTPVTTVAFTISPPLPGGATLTPAPSLQITSVSGGGTGKAYMTWKSSVSPKKGFAILYSTSDKEPVWGKNAYFLISDGTVREAYVDGKAGKTYYYRICTLKEGVCDLYSPAVTFTFP